MMARRRREKILYITKRISITICPPQAEIFWDFGGVITSSPFEAFNKYEKAKNLPENFLRKVNSTNPHVNAWALLEQSKISFTEFDNLFFKENTTIT